MAQSHPRGLYVLYLTELWERFSFYGMKALLVLYLNSGALDADRLPNMLGSSIVFGIFRQPRTPQEVQALSSQLNELYAGAAYLTPIAGGALADRFFGARPTMLAGGLLMAAGHGCLTSERLFLVGLLLLVLGNGGFKPNISSQLSQLYEPPGPTALRDRGFAIFYTGINVGALLAPLVCGAAQQASGYHLGFGVAGIGMLVGLAFYLLGARWLPPAEAPRRRPCCAPPDPAEEAWPLQQALSLLAICLLVIPFWAAYEQTSNTLPLFFQDCTRRSLLGAEVPAAWLQALNPLVCVGCMPLLTGLWARQAARGAEPAPLVKMAIGCALQGSAWALMALGSLGASPERKVSLLLPFAVVVVLTIGELYLSPIGLAFVSKCVPAHARGTAIGFWFLASGLAGPLAGELGVLYSLTPYPLFFALLAALSLANGLLIYGARHRLTRGATSGGESEPLRRSTAQAGSAVQQEPERGVELGYGTRAEGEHATSTTTKRPVASAVGETCSQS